jgi:hypothetical protein
VPERLILARDDVRCVRRRSDENTPPALAVARAGRGPATRLAHRRGLHGHQRHEPLLPYRAKRRGGPRSVLLVKTANTRGAEDVPRSWFPKCRARRRDGCAHARPARRCQTSAWRATGQSAAVRPPHEPEQTVVASASAGMAAAAHVDQLAPSHGSALSKADEPGNGGRATCPRRRRRRRRGPVSFAVFSTCAVPLEATGWAVNQGGNSAPFDSREITSRQGRHVLGIVGMRDAAGKEPTPFVHARCSDERSCADPG